MARYPIATKSNDIDLVPAKKRPRAKRLTNIPPKYEHLTAENYEFNPIKLSIKSGGPNLSETLFSQPNLGPETIFQAFFDNWIVERRVNLDLASTNSLTELGQSHIQI
jgi:hypothetical protein